MFHIPLRNTFASAYVGDCDVVTVVLQLGHVSSAFI